MDKDKVYLIPGGWWLNITPLAKIEPEEWIIGVLKKGKKSWVTEKCKSGFLTPQEAYNWGIDFINQFKKNKQQ
tara:strand:- start:159 stop:377 length:219 start_codon:yes stop_codon:yes gene_type:complete